MQKRKRKTGEHYLLVVHTVSYFASLKANVCSLSVQTSNPTSFFFNVCSLSVQTSALWFARPSDHLQSDNLMGGSARTVVLIGRTGNGKSATGNSILGTKAFDSKICSSGVTTTCEIQTTMLRDGQEINVIDTPVYDCTRFLKDHPGGTDSILLNTGTDCTEEFDAIHSDKAKKMLEEYRIGELMSTGYASDASSSSSSSSSPNNSIHGLSQLPPITETISAARRVALVAWEKLPCKLVSKTSISHDVRQFRFALPLEDQVLGLPVGKHIFLSARIDGKLCMRAYTPTSGIDEVGYFDLVVKIYFKNTNPKFPEGGLMSQHLESLPLGSNLEVKGPLGHIEYTGRGNFVVEGKPKKAKKLAMLAGGTGITPIYQVAQAILNDPEDETEMFLVYANRTENDILLKEELDEWAKSDERFKVWYVVEESVREGWEFSVGVLTECIMREHLPEASPDTFALACGPPPMVKFAVQPNLEKMNYDIANSLLVF